MTNFQTISDITFLPFTVFPGKFNSSQVKPTILDKIFGTKERNTRKLDK